MAHPIFRWACPLVLLALSGCASGLGTKWDTLASVIRGDLSADKLQPIPQNPNLAFRYLRVELEGAPPAMLVLGYIDPHPLGPIDVWYSGQGEVIKLQNGRIVGTTGLPLDWANARFTLPPPAWDAVALGGSPYTRERNELPSYRFGIVDRLVVAPVPSFNGENLPFVLPVSLPRGKLAAYRWFRESVVSNAAVPLPDSWFAIGRHRGQTTVVYSRQCLMPDYCLHIQPWPVQEEAL